MLTAMAMTMNIYTNHLKALFHSLLQVQSLQWQVNVVDDSTMNAFVLGNGQIFVFTGMLEACRSNDELAIILGRNSISFIHSFNNLRTSSIL